MGDQRSRVDLPTELIYSILLRLPVKSLTRFKSVSKSLSNLISHPSFQQDHYLHRKPLPNPLLLLLTETNCHTHTLRFSTFTHDSTPLTTFSKTIPIRGTRYHKKPTRFVLVGSCLGLVCIASASYRTILVCNPSTQDVSLLQPPVQGFIQCIGFGYASSQFKVVRFFNLKRYGTWENCCEVFTLGSSDGWRRTVAPPYKPDWGGPFLNGAIHLMPYKVYGERDQYADYIAAFDVDTEKYHTVPLPEIGDVVLYTPLVVLRGLLCLAFYFETREVLELWFLKDYDDGKWAKEYVIDFSSVDGVLLPYPYPYPVAFMGDGRILLSVHCGGGHYEHLWYNTQEGCFAWKEKYENCSIRLFVETFMPLRVEIAGRPRLLLPYP